MFKNNSFSPVGFLIYLYTFAFGFLEIGLVFALLCKLHGLHNLGLDVHKIEGSVQDEQIFSLRTIVVNVKDFRKQNYS